MTATISVISDKKQDDPILVVEQFFLACSDFDMDRAFALMDENCIYKNVPFHTARGKKRIKRDLTMMTKALNLFEVEMVNIAVNDGVVLTERIDTLGGRFFKADLSLMGVLVVKDGKITEWRDYFDWSASLGKIVSGMVTKCFKK